MKLRPVLLLTRAVGSVPEVLVAYISSVVPPTLLPSDILLDPGKKEHAPTNLKTKSVLHSTNWQRFTLGVSSVTLVPYRRKLRAKSTTDFVHCLISRRNARAGSAVAKGLAELVGSLAVG